MRKLYVIIAGSILLIIACNGIVGYMNAHDDQAWLDSVARNAPIVRNDVWLLKLAMTQHDYDAVSLYGQMLKRDTQIALDENAKYDPSNTFWNAYIDWKGCLIHYNDAGNNAIGATYSDSIGYVNANYYMKQGDECYQRTYNDLAATLPMLTK